MTKTYLAILSFGAVVLTSCGTQMVEVRSIKQPLAQGRQPANFRLAEGNAQLLLGNVGLAVESYRKALREEPDNIDAIAGLATCYDRMGRTDLSRRY
jgi:Flp pilus assembly protein TadD